MLACPGLQRDGAPQAHPLLSITHTLSVPQTHPGSLPEIAACLPLGRKRHALWRMPHCCCLLPSCCPSAAYLCYVAYPYLPSGHVLVRVPAVRDAVRLVRAARVLAPPCCPFQAHHLLLSVPFAKLLGGGVGVRRFACVIHPSMVRPRTAHSPPAPPFSPPSNSNPITLPSPDWLPLGAADPGPAAIWWP